MWFLQKPKPDVIPQEIAGIRVRPSPRARRMALRVDTRKGDVFLTFPKGMSEKKAQRFIEENRDWIAKQAVKAVRPKVFAAGSVIRVLDQDYVIEHVRGRGLTRMEGDKIIVHGASEHISRRAKDFLKKLAVEHLTALADQKAAAAGLKHAAVRVIDPRSRWGSCSADGRLMFSWRLVLAPEEVMDYVVAHEVAHRVHMNHGKKFWALCYSLTPDGIAARRWLRKNGAALHAYG